MTRPVRRTVSERTIERTSLPDRARLYASTHVIGATEAVHQHLVAAGVELVGPAFEALVDTVRLVIIESYVAGGTAPETALAFSEGIRARLVEQLRAAGVTPATARRPSDPPG